MVKILMGCQAGSLGTELGHTLFGCLIGHILETCFIGILTYQYILQKNLNHSIYDIVCKFYDQNTHCLSQINIPKTLFPRLFIGLFDP